MKDLTEHLNDWSYDANDCVRKIETTDGHRLLLVRTPLGIEQYETTGRPDGQRPYGCESVLEHVQKMLKAHVKKHGGDAAFEIDRQLAAELQYEGLLYYYRYLVCFQIGEYQIVISDADRNLVMFDILRDYCTDRELADSSEQYRPYVSRMGAAARALVAIGINEHTAAKKIIRDAINEIKDMPVVETATFAYERKRSLAILRGMLKAVPSSRPLTKADRLRRELRSAVEEEDYERAASIRDQLRHISKGQGADKPR